jgi:tubulin polyglutamylase TTLL6/13
MLQVFWTDQSVSLERVMRLGPCQWLNHFHGMLELCRKVGPAGT